MPLLIAQYNISGQIIAESPFNYNPLRGSTLPDSMHLLGIKFPNLYYQSAITNLPTGHEGIVESSDEQKTRRVKVAALEKQATKAFEQQDFETAAINLFYVNELIQGLWEENAIRIEQHEYQDLIAKPIGTSGLGSCVFVVFCQAGKLAGAHVDSQTDPKSIKDMLKNIPKGKVGVRIFGGHQGHVITSIHNRHIVLKELNDDPHHEFILLSNDPRDKVTAEKLAICAYPPKDDSYVFTVKKRVPTSKNPLNSIIKTFATDNLPFPIRGGYQLPIFKQVTEEEQEALRSKPLWYQARPEEREYFYLQELTPASSDFIATPLTKLHLQKYLPTGSESYYMESWKSFISKVMDYIAYSSIVDKCEGIETLSPEMLSTLPSSDRSRFVIDSCDLLKKVVASPELFHINGGDYAVINNINIKKVSDKEHFELIIQIRLYGFENDSGFKDRYEKTNSVLSTYKFDIVVEAETYRLIKLNLTSAEFRELLKKLKPYQEGEPHSKLNFFQAVQESIDLLLAVSTNQAPITTSSPSTAKLLANSLMAVIQKTYETSSVLRVQTQTSKLRATNLNFTP